MLHALNPTLQYLLVSILFGTVSSLHHTSDFYTCIYSGVIPTSHFTFVHNYSMCIARTARYAEVVSNHPFNEDSAMCIQSGSNVL